MLFKPWSIALALVALLALPGCERSQTAPDAPASPSGELRAPADEALDAVWQGVLPCSDCDGIQTRLRLVADDQGRRYELQETYLAQDGGELFEAQGAWSRESVVIDGTPTAVYRLDDNGVERWFSLKHDGALELLEARDRASADGLAHRLQRM
ncbi:MAG: copper resistance protein NlpE [Arenimonas sp.]|uniref:copper resistance protein NlpE N-terminal domain-containing protein n=1 Tax=Arenimonas sp. TaxID=1872635 RepID=UPI0025BFC83D|nr:copper resistance protein NlpE N-terminal domain-containing protein [Arenimonas sp.]MBW8366552.1 copper resistance protein NlpE [Arenimonas sp.]